MLKNVFKVLVKKTNLETLYVLEKTHVPHRIDKIIGKSLYRWDNPYLMNWFLRMR